MCDEPLTRDARLVRAHVLEAPGRIVTRAMPDPVPRPDEVVVRVDHSGLCGTDVKILHGDIRGHYPLVMGHEVAGVVVGGAGDGLGPGARVVIDPMVYCGRCHYCHRGQTQLCPAGAMLGRDADGGFAELVAVPARNCHVLPAAIDAAEAPLIQVLSTVYHAQELAEISVGDTVVVLGLGVSGQLHVQLAKARGAERVIAVSRNPDKRRLAGTLGADVVTGHGAEARAATSAATGGLGGDVVIESVGDLAILAEAIDLVRPAGRIVPFGIYAGREAQLPFYDLYFKEARIVHPRAAEAADYAPTIALVRDGRVILAPLISDRLPLGDLEQGFARMTAGGGRRLKIVLNH